MKGAAIPVSLDQKTRAKILGRIRKYVLEHHFNAAGVSYEAWTDRLATRTPELLSADTQAFEAGVRQLLSELGSSHTAFYHESAGQVLPQHSINATLRSYGNAGREQWFFLDVFEDGPAHRAGIKPGDVLLAVDGALSAPPSMPNFATGRTFILAIADSRGEHRRDISIEVPYRKATKGRPPLVEPKSPVHAMIAPGVGLLRVPYFAGAFGLRFAAALDTAISNLKRAGAGSLIIDLRGNIGGSLGFARLASYLCPGQLAIGHSLTRKRLRTGYDRGTLARVPMPRTRAELALDLARFAFRDKAVVLLTQALGAQPFHGRVAVLVNEWTNSAGEMLAGFAAENGLATVIGSRTAGNVLGAVNATVGGGYWLRLPIFGWYTSRGDCLEGKGVTPAAGVDVDPNLLNNGIDQVLDTAIAMLSAVRVVPAMRSTDA
jgi:C-terminal processing protease CtpA/Prc